MTFSTLSLGLFHLKGYKISTECHSKNEIKQLIPLGKMIKTGA